MTTRQGPPPKTADKSPEEVSNMAPAERDAYLQKKAEEGVDPDNWLALVRRAEEALRQISAIRDEDIAERPHVGGVAQCSASSARTSRASESAVSCSNGMPTRCTPCRSISSA